MKDAGTEPTDNVPDGAAPDEATPVEDAAREQTQTPTDTAPPPPPAPPAELRLVFPISGATAAAMITARGTTDGRDVAKVLVNGSAATSTDGFRSWRSPVTLAAGENAITAIMERGDGSQVQATATVTRAASAQAIKRGKLLSGVVFNIPGGTVDRQGKAMYFADANADGVLRVDVATGDQVWATCSEHSNVCGDGSSNGVPFSQPMDVAIDDAHQRAFVADGANIFAVDLTGRGGPNERTIVSGPDVTEASYKPPTYAGKGTGPQAHQLGSMTYDPAADVIYAVDWGQGTNDPVGFFKIDPATGNRENFSPIGRGGLYRHIDVDTAGGALFATSAYQNMLSKISLASGAKSAGPMISEPQSLTISTALGAMFVIDKAGALMAFNIGDLSSRAVGGAAIGGPGFSVGGDLVFIQDNGIGGVVAIDPQNGERIVVSR